MVFIVRFISGKKELFSNRRLGYTPRTGIVKITQNVWFSVGLLSYLEGKVKWIIVVRLHLESVNSSGSDWVEASTLVL